MKKPAYFIDGKEILLVPKKLLEKIICSIQVNILIGLY